MTLLSVPIHRAAHRHTLFMGGDREMVMFSGLLAAILVFAAQTWYAFAIGVCLWFGAVFLLRLMAKSDPCMRQVYLRQRRYQSYYPARSKPYRDNTRSQEWQYQ